MNIFFAALLVVTISSILAEISPNIDYQIHSNNDLRELKQVLLKGARRFKFDPHYVPTHPSCTKSQERHQIKNNTAVLHSSASNEPCLLLNHDTPNPMSSSFNSSDDLLSALTSDWFRTIVPVDERVTVALCFKSAPDFCDENSSRFASWLKLVDDFFAQVDQMRATNHLSQRVEFVLDGDAKPTKCLEGRWLPWRSVWIVDQKGDSLYNEAFTSNSAEHDFYRYQVLNNPENVSNWAYMAEADVNYGKFSSSPYPYQLWEPDHQEDIAQYIALYRGGRRHASGLHFAINVDVAMFRLFRDAALLDDAFQRPEALHLSLAATSPASQRTERASNPQLVQLSDSLLLALSQRSGTLELHLLSAASLSDPASSNSSSTVLATASVFAEALQLSAESPLVAALPLMTDSRVVDTHNTLWLTTRDGHSAVLTLSLSLTGDVHLSAHASSVEVSATSDATSVWHDVRPVACKDIAVVEGQCFLAAHSTSDGCVSVTRWQFHLQKLKQLPQTTTLCDRTSPDQVSSAQVVVTHRDTLVVFVSRGGFIFGTTVSQEPVTSRTDDIAWVRLMAGNWVSAQSRGDALGVLSGDGFCFNSHTHNTRSGPSVCDSPATSTQYVLDYSLGLVDDWLDTLRHTDASSGPLLSVCHERLLHGTYHLGSQPRLLLLGKSGGDGPSQLVSLQQGFAEDADYSCGCGLPQRSEDLVLAAVPVREWLDTLRHTAPPRAIR